MKNAFLSLLVAPFLGSLLIAQSTEWVSNGDFTGTLAPWVMGGGYSTGAGLDSAWDTTGLGVSDSFGCSAGGQVVPPPYAPNNIEQQIFVIAGMTYEFRADVSGARPAAPTVGNADTGTVWATVNGIEVARFALGSYSSNPPETKRVQLVGRFVPSVSGMVPLTIWFQRAYLSNTTTPRINIDNVSVKDTPGPTFWINSNRKLSTTVDFTVNGPANAPFASFLSIGRTPGVTFPGMVGVWYLDFSTMTGTGSGVLDASGQFVLSLPIPLLASLVTVPLSYQAVAADAGIIGLGLPSTVVFVN
ncbi:MAG: hypothetical protein U1F36_13495 [Planctomycetota bacterium]